MDPLSIAASTAALLGLVDSAAKGVLKLARLRHATLLLQEVNDELSDLRLVVSQIEDVCRQAPSNPWLGLPPDKEVLSRAIEGGKKAILGLESMIVYGLLMPSSAAERADSKIDRLSWIRKESELRDRVNEIRNTKLNLSLAIGVDIMQSQMKTHLHLVQLQAGNQLILSRQEMLGNFIDSRLPPQARLAISPTSANSQHQDVLQQRTTLPLGPSSSLSSSSSSSTVDPSPAQAIVFRTVSSKLCGSFCSCDCHKMKKHLRSPIILDPLLGSLQFIGYETLSQMTKPSCNLSDCRRGNVSRTVVSYTFPRWFLDRVVMLQSRLPTPELILRILRIRPNDSDIFNAVTRQDISRVRSMIADGTASVRDVNEKGETLISIGLAMATNYDNDFFRELKRLGTDIFQLDNRPMSAYLLFWQLALIDPSQAKDRLDIFDSELDLDHFQFTPLQAAILNIGSDHATPEQVLCATPREQINEQDQLGRTAISWACAKSDLQMLEKLLKMGADPNIADKTGRTSLHHLAYRSISVDEQCLDALLDNGANVNVRSIRGKTPLHDFVMNPHCTASCIEKFYLKGADLNARDDYGWTPVLWAGRYGDLELIDKLIQCGADLEIQNSLGITPLSYALIRHQFGTFKYLLELGCDHSFRIRSDSTLLHICARDGDIDMLHYLAQKGLRGIDPDDRDKDGFTALERAERRRDGVYEWVDLVEPEATRDAEPQVWFEAYLALNEKSKRT